MRIKKKLLIAMTFAFFFITACRSITPTPYSFSEYDRAHSARLTIGDGVSLVDLDGTEPPEGIWSTAYMLPAGKPMDIRLYIYWNGNIEGNRRRGIFKCPPLEAGNEYRLRFNLKTSGVFVETPVDGYSIVLEKKRAIKTLLGSSYQYERIYNQVVPPLP